MMADVADEHYYATGFRQEDIFFGTIAFSSKATSGFGTLIGGIGIDVIAWPRSADPIRRRHRPGNHRQPRHPLRPHGRRVLDHVGVLLTHYGISRERLAEILRELNARRQTARDSTN